MRLLIFTFILSTVVLSACDNSRVFERNIDFENNYWKADSIVTLGFDIKETQVPYNLYLNIRNTNDYANHNLYIKYALQDSLGDTLNIQLVNNQLFNPKTGKPYGSGLGSIFSHQFLLMKNYTFENAGKYQLSLQQYMRKDSINGIISAGARMEKAPVEN